MNPFLPTLMISLCACSHALATIEEDEALVAKDIEALHDEHEEVRSKAFLAELRGIIYWYPQRHLGFVATTAEMRCGRRSLPRSKRGWEGLK